MTFLEGFAQGFMQERNRRLEREEKQEDDQFRFGMQALLNKQELRQKKQQQVEQWKAAAQAAAKQMGDPEFAPVAYQQLAGGRTLDQIMDDIKTGSWEKTGTSTPAAGSTIKLPAGVIGEREEGDPAQAPTNYAQPTVNKAPTITDLKNDKGEPVFSEKAVNRIKNIDPDLMNTSTDVEPAYKPEDVGNWSYRPKSELKVEDIPTLRYKYQLAQASGDKAQMANLQMKLKIQEQYQTEKTLNEMSVQGKNVNRFAVLKPDGTLDKVIGAEKAIDEDGNTFFKDAVTGKPIQAQEGQIIPFSEEASKEHLKLMNDFSDKSAKVSNSIDSYVGALNTANEVKKLLAKDDTLPSLAAGVASGAATLSKEFEAASKILDDQQKEVETALGKDGDSALAAIDKYEKTINQALSEPNKTRGDNYKLYTSLMKLTAYKLAAANGIGGKDLSNKDFENFYNSINSGGNGKTVVKQLNNQLTTVFAQLESSRLGLVNDPRVDAFKQTFGVKPDLKAPRVGDRLKQLGRDDLFNMFQNDIYNPFKSGTQAATQQIEGNNQQPQQSEQPQQNGQEQQPQQNDAVQIKSVEEYNKLPKGTVYIDPNGNRRVKK